MLIKTIGPVPNISQLASVVLVRDKAQMETALLGIGSRHDIAETGQRLSYSEALLWFPNLEKANYME